MRSGSHYDVAVIGGGPIGSYAAWRLSRSGFSVVIIEEHPEAGHPEQCAGLVNRAMFDLPLLDQVLDRVRLHDITGANIYSPSGRNLALRAGKVKAVSIDRAGLDKVLFRMAASSGAEPLISTKALSLERSGSDHHTVKCKGALGSGSIDADFVLGCDGASSMVRRSLGLEKPLDVIPGVSIRVETDDGRVPQDIVGVFTGKETAKGFFAWSVPSGTTSSMRVGLAANDGASLRTGWNSLMRDPRLGEWLGMEDGRVPGMGRLSFNLGPVPMGSPRTIISGNAVILGDSAGMAKPTSGGGIYPGLMAVDELVKAVDRAGGPSSTAFEEFRGSWLNGYGKELSRSRFFRRLISQVEDREVEEVVERFSDPELLEIVNREGDIDHPLRLALQLIKKDPSLLKMIPRFLPHMRNLVR
ncbi:MAG: geranylgeranyl reductase family protein [Thermoplasmatota archaeon]